MDAVTEYTIEQIVDVIKAAKVKGKKTTLFIGAGCSVTAGIKVGKDIAKEIRLAFPNRTKDCKTGSYVDCMKAITTAQRHRVIEDCCKDAVVNPAHLAIAELIRQEYVDLVLTTNFDQLLQRACSLVGETPAIYDLAMIRYFNAGMVSKPAIIYLNGQQTGFIQLHDTTQQAAYRRVIAQAFQFADLSCPWVVSGYSGKNDAIFKHFLKPRSYDEGLFWNWYSKSSEELSPDVEDKLIRGNKQAYFLDRKYEADEFFKSLAGSLSAYDPDFIERPMDYLLRKFNEVGTKTAGEEPVELPELKFAKDKVKQYKKQFDDDISNNSEGATIKNESMKLSGLLFQGKYDEIVQQAPQDPSSADKDLRYLYAEAYSGLAVKKQSEVYSKGSEASAKDFEDIYQMYERAVAFTDQLHEAWFYWALALLQQALEKGAADSAQLMVESFTKFGKAVEIKPDYSQAWHGWGLALCAHAKTMVGEDRERLLQESCEKFAVAAEIEPDDYEVWVHWSEALGAQAAGKTPEQAVKLFEEALEKAKKADEIKPGAGSYNAACACARLGQFDECRDWLLRSKEFSFLPTKQDILDDPDLEAVRDFDWFQELLASLPDK